MRLPAVDNKQSDSWRVIYRSSKHGDLKSTELCYYDIATLLEYKVSATYISSLVYKRPSFLLNDESLLCR